MEDNILHEKVNQDKINKSLLAVCNNFTGIDFEVYKNLIPAIFFIKYISDTWQYQYDEYKNQYGDEPELIAEMMQNERFVLPKEASFYSLYK